MSIMIENSAKKVAYIGIDPGKDGAMAALCYDVDLKHEVYLQGFDRVLLRRALKSLKAAGFAICVVVEHVGGIPGQSAPAAFNFGENAGFIHGVLETLEIPYELVRPQKWKKEFSCTSDKNTSINVAKRLFPEIDLRKSPRCTKDHDGLAEALLMAEYARRRNMA